VRLADVVPAADAAAPAARPVADVPVTDELVAPAAEVLAAVHGRLLDEGGTVAEVVVADDYDRLVAVAAGMDDARRDPLKLRTTSAAYTGLVSHVLYHGVKSHVPTQNLLARRIPAAPRRGSRPSPLSRSSSKRTWASSMVCLVIAGSTSRTRAGPPHRRSRPPRQLQAA
jgi:hypothetical protein